MQDKIFVFLVYALIGIAMATSPLLTQGRNVVGAAGLTPSTGAFGRQWTMAVLLALLAGLLLVTGLSKIDLVFCLLALAVSLRGKTLDPVAVLASLLALCVSVTLPWWRWSGSAFRMSTGEWVAFSVLTVPVVLMIARPSPAAAKPVGAWIAVFTLCAAALSFSTSVFNNVFNFYLLWHHWGAYVGPSELLLSGAAIFHDFPAQYGLGPAALIASACTNSCWKGMYVIAGFTTLAFSLLIALMAFTLAGKSRATRVAVLILCLVTCFFWSAFPPVTGSPIMTPSVTGLRFLPATLLTAYLFFSPHIERSKNRLMLAHGLWMLAALWAPESAFYATLVWWPYYLFLHRVQGTLGARIMALAAALARLLAIAAALIAAFILIFHAIYHEGPTLFGYLAYVLSPSGPMPINWSGAVWFYIFVMAAGLASLWLSWRQDNDSAAFRRGFLLLLLSYGTFSYFLSRSHDNNLLNMLPFSLLVLLSVMAQPNNRTLVSVSTVVTATFVGWLSVFGWQAWSANVSTGHALSFAPAPVIDAMTFASPQTDAAVNGLVIGDLADAGRAVEFLRQRYGEPITVLDNSMTLVRSVPTDTWSAIHGPANFVYMPSPRRREFLINTAARLKRSGWLVVDRKFPAEPWLADYDVAYDRTNRIEFGTYYAVRFTPKVMH